MVLNFYFSDSLPQQVGGTEALNFLSATTIMYDGLRLEASSCANSFQSNPILIIFLCIYNNLIVLQISFAASHGPYRTGLLLMTPGWLQWLDGRDPEIWWKQTPARANAQYKIIGPSITHVMLHTIKCTRVQIKCFMEISHVSSSHETCLGDNKTKYFRLRLSNSDERFYKDWLELQSAHKDLRESWLLTGLSAWRLQFLELLWTS